MMKRKFQAISESGWKKSEIHYSWIDLNDVSPNVPLAIIASEDQNFKDHYGFDVSAIQKAMKYNKKHTKKKRGASTLSQQVAKNAFLWEERSWIRKGLELYFTLLIETFWSKKRILEVYINIAEMGDKIFGIDQASIHYYKCSPKKLSREQSAMIGAVLPNPKRYKVKNPSPYVLKRKGWILRQMNQIGKEYLKEL